MAGVGDIIGDLNLGNALGLPQVDFTQIIDSMFPGLMEFLNILLIILFLSFCFYLGFRVMKGYKGHLNAIIKIVGIVGFGFLCIILGTAFGYSIANLFNLDITNKFISGIFEYIGAVSVSVLFYIVLRIMFEGPKYVSLKDLEAVQKAINSLKEEVYEIKSALKKKGFKFKENKNKIKKETFKEQFLDSLKEFISVRKIIGIVIIIIFVVFVFNSTPKALVGDRISNMFSFAGIPASSSAGTIFIENYTQGQCLSEDTLSNLFSNQQIEPLMIDNQEQFMQKTYPLVSNYNIDKNNYLNSSAFKFNIKQDTYYAVSISCNGIQDCTDYVCIFLGENKLCECYVIE